MFLEKINKRVYATVNLDAIKHNVRAISENISKDTKIMAIIKADGYGHGAVRIASVLDSEETIAGFAVATIEEALELKHYNIKKPILILGYIFPEEYEALIKNDIRATVFDTEAARQLGEVACKLGKMALVHLKVDTGMGRIGFRCDESGIEIAKKIYDMEGVEVEGIFTHLARADEADKSNVNAQIARFKEFVTRLEARGINIPIKHCSNSAGIVDHKEANMDMVRAGIILYGLWPSNEVHKDTIDLKPAMEIKSAVVYVKDVEAGRQISYGGTYETTETRRIATVSIGYADGYPRVLSNKGQVLIRGKRANIVGRVCMDQVMVDVTDIPGVSRGDEVTVIGRDGDDCITFDEFASLAGTINYESICDIGKRVPRLYIRID